MYDELKHMYCYSPSRFSILIHHGGCFGKFPGGEYRGGHLSFDIMDIDGHLLVGNVDVVHFNGSGHDGLSHDETFCTDDLNPPFDLNIPTEVSDEYAISEGIVIRVDDQCQTEHELVHDRVNEHIHTRLVIVAVMVDEHIDNDDPVETGYDVKFSENEGNKDDEDVIVDEENE
ncbi:hypothetical protein Tco_0256434, partial [Tanacetum coccineum]